MPDYKCAKKELKGQEKIMISLDENNKKLESLKDRLIDVGDSL